MNQAARPIPEGFHSLTPHLVCADAAQAIDFYAKAFGAVEISRLAGPDGKVWNAQLRIGDSMLMVVDAMPEHGSLDPLALKGSPVSIHLYVADADAQFQQAVAAGATPQMPPEDVFWGDRFCTVQDPYGHRWSIATHLRDLTPEQTREEMVKAVAQQQGCAGEPQ